VLERDPIVVTTGTTPQPGETLEVTAGDDGWPELESVASALGAAGVIDALVEGGPTLAGGFWRAGLIDRGVWYLAGRVGGGSGRSVFSGLFATLEQARGIEIIDVRRLGTDLRVEFVMED
jgi:diaminohydroxyphosphoribosylaminopyrimidine deaminase/5-amino-6-(5-phosphoribosylamino)uracil reductase